MQHKHHLCSLGSSTTVVLAAYLMLWAMPACAQFKYTALTTEIAGLDWDIAQYEVEVLSRYVAEYPRMTPDEQKAWEDNVDSPYPGATAPVEAAHVDWILQALNSDTFAKQESYWPFAYHALGVLLQLVPDAPELPPIAQRILSLKLPPPHGRLSPPRNTD